MTHDSVDQRRHAPATLRNREAILRILSDWLPARSRVLEVASGSGEHAAFFAAAGPGWAWWASDPDAGARASIAAHLRHAGAADAPEPLALQAHRLESWPPGPFDAVFCSNMIHIAPWAACVGVMAGAARVLAPGGALILYGPFLRDDVQTAPSNLDFDADLRARDPSWGLRRLEDVDVEARRHGLEPEALAEMPANNLMRLWRHPGDARDSRSESR